MHNYSFCRLIPSTLRQRNSAHSPVAAGAKQTWRSLLTGAAVLLAASAAPLAAQVPAVVATNTISLATGFSAGPAVLDACGNVYVYEGGGTGVVQINAVTGVVTVVAKNSQGYTSSGQALYMDTAKKYLYYPDFSNFYTTHFVQMPINNCAPGTPNATFANNLGNLGNYYWGTIMDGAGDAAGNVYFTTTTNVQGAIYKETYVASTNTYTDTQIITWKNNMNHIVADAAGDVYFVDQSTSDVYVLPITGTTYPAAPTILVSASHFGTVSGLSFDPLGNLYITDSKNNLVFEVPLEKGTLNPADMYATASVGVPFKVAVDASHAIYLSNSSPGAAKLTPGSALFASTAVGSTSANSTLTYVFNSAVTATAIKTFAGAAATTRFAISGGTCVVGTAQAALSNCTITATFTPSAVGRQTAALVYTYATGSLTSNLAGVGNGAAATIDPGTVVPSTTVLTSPSGVAVDNVGNVFVTDTSANTLTKFTAGATGVGTVVSTGTLKLSGAKAVAVDALGDIFIADTGNSRIVEIPVVSGVLANASTFALSLTPKNPQGVAVDSAGNLYVADTGNNNILVVPNIAGSLNFAQAQSYGTGLKGPAAMTFDQTGNLFVAETSGNDVLEFTAPLGSSAQLKVASGFSTPTGVATDGSNSLYVVDSGSGSIARFPNVSGVLGAKSLVGVTVVNPIGVAADSNGNLYVTDTTNGVTAEIARVTAAMQFGGVNVGSTGTQSSSINSSGNQPLIFPKPDYTIKANPAPGFNVTADTCAASTMNPGSACTITATYTATAPQLNAEEDLQFSANSSNGTPLLQLIGTGAHITPSTVALVLTSPAGATSLNAGQAVSFTATIGIGSNTATPGGSVKFLVNGIQVGTVAVKNATASLSLPNGLPSGNAVGITATYTGDVINYSGSTATLTEVVIALADTVTLTITTPYNNPLSANDNAANAAGPSIPLVATIVPSSTIAPGGTVTFYAGSTNLGIVSVVPGAGGAYTATLTTTALRAGTTNKLENGSYVTTYTVYAVYSGDSIYAAGTTGSQLVTIVGADTAASPGNTTGATFTITPTNPTVVIQSSTAGGQASGSVALTVTSYGGWTGVLNFSCSGLPAYATCNPFPGSPIINSSTPSATVPPTPVNFVINTNVQPLVPTAVSIPWWTGGVAGLLLLAVRRRLAKLGYLRTGSVLATAGIFALMLASVFGVTACSSSTSLLRTPAGTSNVIVTVHAAQFVAGSTTNVQAQDVQTVPINITLTVQ